MSFRRTWRWGCHVCCGVRGHEHYLTRSRSITGSIAAERRDYDDLDYLDGNFFSTSLAYRGPLSEDHTLSLRFGVSRNIPEQEHLRYLGATTSAEVTRPLRNLGILGVNLGAGLREYDGTFPALGEGRADREASIGLSFRAHRLKAFGASPKLSCQLQQTWSNVALYEYQSTDCIITFERNF